MFSLCPHLGGGGSVQLGGGQVSSAGGVRSFQPGGGGQFSPAGGGVRSVQLGGSVTGGGGAKIGQQNEYSLHGRRYALAFKQEDLLVWSKILV